MINHDQDIERRFFQLDRLTSMSEAAKRAFLLAHGLKLQDELMPRVRQYAAMAKGRVN